MQLLMVRLGKKRRGYVGGGGGGIRTGVAVVIRSPHCHELIDHWDGDRA
jgi:hypothetical protein